jgi:hypothetical protein
MGKVLIIYPGVLLPQTHKEFVKIKKLEVAIILRVEYRCRTLTGKRV